MNEWRYGSAHINLSDRVWHICIREKKNIDVSDYYWKWCAMCHITVVKRSPPSISLILTFARIKGDLNSCVVRYLASFTLLFSLSLSYRPKWDTERKACTLTNPHAHIHILLQYNIIFSVQCQGHIRNIDGMPWLSSANIVLNIWLG